MTREQFDDVEWLPADMDVVKKIRSMDIDSLS
jgi:8-oxo-dGTP diphosphatase